MMRRWQNCLVQPTDTIYQVIEKIDKSSLQIALVADGERRLLGTVTDGDVRRALLKGIDLSCKVELIMNDKPKTAVRGQTKESILAFMKKSHLHQIPIVDEDNVLLGLESLDFILKSNRKENAVVLMAGGLGTRLRPLTENCPKPMLLVGNKPILETILNSFIEYGFYKFYLSVNYKREMIKNYFGDGSKWGVDIEYLEEDKRLGTAGALSLLPMKTNLPVLVMNGDLLTQVNFQHLLEFHEESQALATMCVREYNYQIPYGVIETDNDKIVKITEKPLKSYFVNAGIYALSPEVLDLIPQDEFYDMPDLFQQVMRNKAKVNAFPIREYWLDIGQRDDFERAQGEYENIFLKI